MPGGTVRGSPRAAATRKLSVPLQSAWLVAGSAVFGADDPADAYGLIARSVEWG